MFNVTEEDVKDVINRVNAIIVGIPFPFFGTDNTSACENIYDAETNTKTPCPLKGGKQYIYKGSFEILPIYPNVSLINYIVNKFFFNFELFQVKVIVHWQLDGPSGQLFCFEVPARITN